MHDLWAFKPSSHGKSRRIRLKDLSRFKSFDSTRVTPSCTSYHPLSEDHKTGIMEAVSILSKEREKQKEMEVMTENNNIPCDEPEILLVSDAEECDESDEVFRNKKIDRLPLKVRKRRATARANTAKQEKELKERKFLKSIGEAGKDRKNLINNEKMLTERLKKRKKLISERDNDVDNPPCIGRHKFEPPFPCIATPDEINNPLYSISPATNLVEQQFKNFQRRRLILPSVRQKSQKKAKRKVFGRNKK